MTDDCTCMSCVIDYIIQLRYDYDLKVFLSDIRKIATLYFMSRAMSSQSNRYPLHYAYALPAETSREFVALLLERNPEDIETRLDSVSDCRELSE